MCQHNPPPDESGRTGAALEHGDAHRQDHARWSRRDFLSMGLKALAAAPLVLGRTPLTAFGAAPGLPHALQTDRILILIQLNGGNDGLNTVVPLGNDRYYQRRPTIGLREADTLRLTADTGLNRGLAPLESWWEEGRMGIVRNVGYPDQNLSHFRSTDIWKSGTDAATVADTGWAGRALDATNPGFLDEIPERPLAVQIGGAQSLLFQGPDGGMALTLRNTELFERLAGSGAAYPTDGLPDTHFGRELAWVRQVANQSYTYAGAVRQAATQARNEVEYPAGTLSESLAIAARLIKGRLGARIYMVSLSGFDTHANQIDRHETLMRQLSGAVMAFYDDLSRAGMAQHALAATFSEFGRRVNENGSAGTDHGSAAPLFLFGDGALGGFHGAAPDLVNLDAAGNLKFDTDYRSVFAALLRDWLGVPDQQVGAVFGSDAQKLNLVSEPADTGIVPDGERPNRLELHPNAPNPFNPSTRLSWSMAETGHVRLRVFDTLGRLVATLVDEVRPAGTHQVTFDAGRLPSGVYLCTLEAGGVTRSRRITLVK